MKRSVITIGTFDGVHKGHQVILNKVVEIAKKDNLRSVVISFENPVKKVSGLITSIEEKKEILSSFKIDKILFLPVDEKIISMTAQDFFENVLVKKLNVSHIVVGYDCAFGRNREGNISWLQDQTKKYNIKLDIINPIKVKDVIVSSSVIRQLIDKSDIDSVNEMLGRSFEIKGVHVSGNQIGRTIGFPTINIKTSSSKLLPMGTFVCRLEDESKKIYPGVLNIGIRPTVNIKEHPISIEVHLLNYSNQWKDKNIKLYIDKFIRREQKFKDIEELKQTIQLDVDTALQFF